MIKNMQNIEIGINDFMNIKDNDDVVVIDIRSDIERSYGNIKNSIHLDGENLKNAPPHDANQNYIICCSRGKTSYEIAKELRDRGFSNYYSLKGGYSSYVLYMIRNDKQNESNTILLDKVEKSIQTKFRTKLMSNFLKAIKIYKLIKENDRIAVCISGGKDSFLMAMLFRELKKWSKINFDVEYISMDPGYNETNRKLIEENAKALDIPIKIFESDIFNIVYNEEKSPFLQCACKFTDTCATCNNNENAQVDTLLSYKIKGARHSFLENFDD